MIACRVFIVPINNVIESTYCENLLALVFNRYVVDHKKSESNAESSVKYLSVRCVQS